jgi:uncharacterized protein YndB with AHSA1/START domain
MSDITISKDAVVIERILDAPVDVIWKLWTEPEHFRNWYGPKGFTVPVAEMDVRIGGRHLFCMERQTPDGSMKMWSSGEYTEVVPNKRLVYTDSMSDEHGNMVVSEETNDGYPATTEVTVLLEDLDGRTKMVVRHAGVPANDQGAAEGWTQAFDKMMDYIETITGNKQ